MKAADISVFVSFIFIFRVDTVTGEVNALIISASCLQVSWSKNLKVDVRRSVQIPESQSNRAGQKPHSLQEAKHLSVQIPQHTLSVHASTDRITEVSSFIFQLS